MQSWKRWKHWSSYRGPISGSRNTNSSSVHLHHDQKTIIVIAYNMNTTDNVWDHMNAYIKISSIRHTWLKPKHCFVYGAQALDNENMFNLCGRIKIVHPFIQHPKTWLSPSGPNFLEHLKQHKLDIHKVAASKPQKDYFLS